MSLRDMMLADADAALSDLPAEDALYLPTIGSVRSIRVVVEREEETASADPRTPRRPLVVSVKNNTSGGIAGSEIAAGDRLRVAKVKGGEQVAMRINRLRDETPGWLELELE